MAWDLNNSTRNSNPPLRKAWGIYTPQRRKLVVGPRATSVRPVFEKLSIGASGTSQTGQAWNLALHHRDQMAQVMLGGFVSTLKGSQG
jgi:hypothetical protein